MGFFSFITQDTNKSIANAHSNRPTFTVYLMDDKGNLWVEDDYEGYGVFGGKDYYELLAEMNGKTTRDEGITLAFGKEPFIAPNLVEDPSRLYSKDAPKDCPYQGYFFDDDDEDEDEDEEFNKMTYLSEKIENLIEKSMEGRAFCDLISFTDFFMRVENCKTVSDIQSSDVLYQLIDERQGFDTEVIYYHNAIKYLKENDPSLHRCMEIAYEFRYSTSELNSELLASLLATEINKEKFLEQTNIFDLIDELTDEYLKLFRNV